MHLQIYQLPTGFPVCWNIGFWNITYWSYEFHWYLFLIFPFSALALLICSSYLFWLVCIRVCQFCLYFQRINYNSLIVLCLQCPFHKFWLWSLLFFFIYCFWVWFVIVFLRACDAWLRPIFWDISGIWTNGFQLAKQVLCIWAIPHSRYAILLL
jgi:hypothetical protein